MKDLINQIKQKMNIVTIIGQYLNLQKKGTSFLATCPFHSDTNPSLTISEKKQIFKCFVCNVGGDGINFVAQYEKISYLEALKKLANLLNIEYKFNFNNKKINYTKEQEEVLNVLKDANDYFMNLIFSVKGKIGFEYCKKRNLEPKLIEIFKIGYKDESSNLYDFLLSKNHNEDAIINSNLFRKSNKCWFDNRLIFALTNDEGDIVGFTGRILNNDKDANKYLNSPESSLFKKNEILYNYFAAKPYIEKEKVVYILEGQFDVIALYKSNYKNALALMGLNFSKYHLTILKNYQINLFLDPDIPGKQNCLNIILFLLKNNISKINVVNNTTNLDADQIYHKLGKEELINILTNKLINWESFVFETLKPKEWSNIEMIEKFLNQISIYFYYSTKLNYEFYVNKISKLTSLDAQTIKNKIKNKFFNSNNSTNRLESLKSQELKVNIVAFNPLLSLLKSIYYQNDIIEIIVQKNLSKYISDNFLPLFNYLITKNKNKNDEQKFREKINLITNKDIKIYRTKNEIIQLINRVKENHKKELIKKIDQKIKTTKDQKVKLELINKKIQLLKNEN